MEEKNDTRDVLHSDGIAALQIKVASIDRTNGARLLTKALPPLLRTLRADDEATREKVTQTLSFLLRQVESLKIPLPVRELLMIYHEAESDCYTVSNVALVFLEKAFLKYPELLSKKRKTSVIPLILVKLHKAQRHHQISRLHFFLALLENIDYSSAVDQDVRVKENKRKFAYFTKQDRGILLNFLFNFLLLDANWKRQQSAMMLGAGASPTYQGSCGVSKVQMQEITNNGRLSDADTINQYKRNILSFLTESCIFSDAETFPLFMAGTFSSRIPEKITWLYRGEWKRSTNRGCGWNLENEEILLHVFSLLGCYDESSNVPADERRYCVDTSILIHLYECLSNSRHALSHPLTPSVIDVYFNGGVTQAPHGLPGFFPIPGFPIPGPPFGPAVAPGAPAAALGGGGAPGGAPGALAAALGGPAAAPGAPAVAPGALLATLAGLAPGGFPPAPGGLPPFPGLPPGGLPPFPGLAPGGFPLVPAPALPAAPPALRPSGVTFDPPVRCHNRTVQTNLTYHGIKMVEKAMEFDHDFDSFESSFRRISAELGHRGFLYNHHQGMHDRALEIRYLLYRIFFLLIAKSPGLLVAHGYHRSSIRVFFRLHEECEQLQEIDDLMEEFCQEYFQILLNSKPSIIHNFRKTLLELYSVNNVAGVSRTFGVFVDDLMSHLDRLVAKREHRLAFLKGFHPSLGRESVVRGFQEHELFDANVLDYVWDYLEFWKH